MEETNLMNLHQSHTTQYKVKLAELGCHKHLVSQHDSPPSTLIPLQNGNEKKGRKKQNCHEFILIYINTWNILKMCEK